jgi:pectate lyase
MTNLNTSGPGSLTAGLEAEGPRVIVFEVSGNIDFRPYRALAIKNPHLTVAGQTAPSPGITLVGCELHLNAHDVLLQHIRVRVGDLTDPTRPEVDPKSGWSQWSERDCLKVNAKASRIVIDHCSFSWATDELVQTRGNDVTFRHNLFSECLATTKHHKGAHSKALIVLDQAPKDRVDDDARESRNVAIYGNLFAHNGDRHPQATGGSTGAIINNLMYDAEGAKPHIGITVFNTPVEGSRGGGISVSVIGNHFDRVPRIIRLWPSAPHVLGQIYLDDLLVTSSRESPGSPSQTVDEPVADPWNSPHVLKFHEWMGEPLPPERDPERSKVTEPPVVVPNLEIRPVAEVRSWVLATAGARPLDRDPVDARIVQQVRDRTGRIPASQEDVGGWPELAQNRRELELPANPNGDDDGDGYTNLEQWLHGFSEQVTPVGRRLCSPAGRNTRKRP